MTLAYQTTLPPQAAYTDEPIFRLSVERYHQLIEAGTLAEDDPVELLEGILTYKMPKKTPHSTSNKLVRREIERRLPPGWHLQSQDPITLSDGEPEPDGAVVRGIIEDYADAHPGPNDVALVIEVADSSLSRDRGIKLRSYARAKLPEYWIINLLERTVEVYREPQSITDAEPTYARREVHGTSESLQLTLGGVELEPVAVAQLLPPMTG